MIQFIYAIFSGCWRRWFGGYNIGCDKYEDAFFNKRWFRYIIGLLITGLFLLYKKCNYFQIIGADCILYFLYWAKAHGEFYDFGHNNPPDISRYEKFWWWKYVKKIIPTEHLYQWHCDFICMAIRYTLPALLLCAILLQFPIMFAGILVACGYALMWVLFDWKKIDNPTEWAELIAGFITGLLL